MAVVKGDNMQEIQDIMGLSPWEIGMYGRPSVLIVDDDKEVRNELQYAFNSYNNMEVTLCDNGKSIRENNKSKSTKGGTK
jgi:hypothetical protein